MIGTSYHITSHHITSHHITSHHKMIVPFRSLDKFTVAVSIILDTFRSYFFQQMSRRYLFCTIYIIIH